MEIWEFRGIILFILTFLNLAFAFFLWRRGRKDKATFHLGLTAFFSALYTFTCGATVFFWDRSYSWQLFLGRSTWLGVLILPAYLTFVYYFTGRTRYIKLKSFLWYLGAGIISYLALTTPYFIKSTQVNPPFIQQSAGIGDPLGRFFIFLAVIVGLSYILKEYFKSTGFRKLQIKYFISGIIIYSIGGIVFVGILPLIERQSRYFDITALFSFFFIVLTSYAILRYRLMELRFVLGRTAVYILSILAEIVIAFLMIFLNTQLGFLLPANIILVIALIIIALSFHPLFRFFEKMAGKYFYYTFYTLQTTLAGLAKQLSQTVELDKLTNLINRSLLDALKLDRVGIILKEPEKKVLIPQQLINFDKEDISILLSKEDNFLAQYLKKIKKPIVREEIPLLIRETEKEEERKLNLLKEEMEKREVALCLPLFVEEELTGMIILGNKLSGEAYTVQDINLLTTLTAQAAIAFNNALSYSEIEKRKEELERVLKAVVGRELRMIELKKKIKELEEKNKK